MRLALAVAAAIVSLASPQGAMAALAWMAPPPPAPPGYRYTPILHYAAAAGEANHVRLRGTGKYRQLVDAGAVIQAGRRCKSLGPHRVRCSWPGYTSYSILVNLGDRPDVLTATAAEFDALVANGGPGRDRLAGAGALYGDAGDDVLAWATCSGGFPDVCGSGLIGGPGDDVLRGGPSMDDLRGARATTSCEAAPRRTICGAVPAPTRSTAAAAAVTP